MFASATGNKDTISVVHAKKVRNNAMVDN